MSFDASNVVTAVVASTYSDCQTFSKATLLNTFSTLLRVSECTL